jgi:hypothetical protein
VWSVPGLIINPDFAIGDDATSKLVLGVDMNGWHAVSGFLITVPAFLVARRPYLATVFCAASAGGLLGHGRLGDGDQARGGAGSSTSPTRLATYCCTSPPRSFSCGAPSRTSGARDLDDGRRQHRSAHPVGGERERCEQRALDAQRHQRSVRLAVIAAGEHRHP